MESVSWNAVSYAQASLPKLRIAKEESNRRDSLSSSRTGDSGYISDPEISLSPLDLVGPDQLPHATPSYSFDSPALFEFKDAAPKTKQLFGGAHGSILIKIHKAEHKTPPDRKAEVTSNPLAFGNTSNDKLDWKKAFKTPVEEPESAQLQEVASFRNEDVEQWVKENLHPQDRPKERNSSIISLSSTGSCDMYSTADDSDGEDAPQVPLSTLPKATLKTIELIMRKIEVNLAYAAYAQCAGGNTSKGRACSGNTSRAGNGSSQNSGGKRKSRTDDYLPPDDPDEDGSNKRRRVSIATTDDSENGPRFACPFFKHDPNRYRHRRTCPGPGWPSVHRMKEHLYRSHAQPIYCFRCYSMFDSDSELATHSRSSPCQVSAPQPVDGIDRKTLDKLRKRSPALRLEEDKWRDTYQLLFPDVSVADIPSAYYDSDSPTEESRRFRRELLERIRRELFATAEQESGPVEQRLLRRVAEIIQRCEQETVASFYPSSTHLHPSLPTPASTSRRTSEVTFQEPLQPSPYVSGPMSAPASPLSSFHAPQQSESVLPDRHHGHSLQTIQHPARVTLQHIPESTAPYPASLLNDSFQWSSNDWIDWTAVFPPGSGDADPS